MFVRKGEYAFNLESGVSIEVEGECIAFRTPEGISRHIPFGSKASADAAFEKILEEYGNVIDLDITAKKAMKENFPPKFLDKFVTGDD